MTLNTEVMTIDHVDAHEVFKVARRLVGGDLTDAPIRELIDNDIWGHNVLGHPAGFGLPALLDVHYRTHGPLVREGEVAEYDDEPDPTPHWVSVCFDTTYGYSVDGRGCGDLHAAIVEELGAWLDQQDVRWCWVNEFTGEAWGPGPERYERLGDLGRAGGDAREWLHSMLVEQYAPEVIG